MPINPAKCSLPSLWEHEQPEREWERGTNLPSVQNKMLIPAWGKIQDRPKEKKKKKT